MKGRGRLRCDLFGMSGFPRSFIGHLDQFAEYARRTTAWSMCILLFFCCVWNPTLSVVDIGTEDTKGIPRASFSVEDYHFSALESRFTSSYWRLVWLQDHVGYQYVLFRARYICQADWAELKRRFQTFFSEGSSRTPVQEDFQSLCSEILFLTSEEAEYAAGRRVYLRMIDEDAVSHAPSEEKIPVEETNLQLVRLENILSYKIKSLRAAVRICDVYGENYYKLMASVSTVVEEEQQLMQGCDRSSRVERVDDSCECVASLGAHNQSGDDCLLGKLEAALSKRLQDTSEFLATKRDASEMVVQTPGLEEALSRWFLGQILPACLTSTCRGESTLIDRSQKSLAAMDPLLRDEAFLSRMWLKSLEGRSHLAVHEAGQETEPLWIVMVGDSNTRSIYERVLRLLSHLLSPHFRLILDHWSFSGRPHFRGHGRSPIQSLCRKRLDIGEKEKKTSSSAENIYPDEKFVWGPELRTEIDDLFGGNAYVDSFFEQISDGEAARYGFPVEKIYRGYSAGSCLGNKPQFWDQDAHFVHEKPTSHTSSSNKFRGRRNSLRSFAVVLTVSFRFLHHRDHLTLFTNTFHRSYLCGYRYLIDVQEEDADSKSRITWSDTPGVSKEQCRRFYHRNATNPQHEQQSQSTKNTDSAKSAQATSSSSPEDVLSLHRSYAERLPDLVWFSHGLWNIWSPLNRTNCQSYLRGPLSFLRQLLHDSSHFGQTDHNESGRELARSSLEDEERGKNGVQGTHDEQLESARKTNDSSISAGGQYVPRIVYMSLPKVEKHDFIKVDHIRYDHRCWSKSLSTDPLLREQKMNLKAFDLYEAMVHGDCLYSDGTAHLSMNSRNIVAQMVVRELFLTNRVRESLVLRDPKIYSDTERNLLEGAYHDGNNLRTRIFPWTAVCQESLSKTTDLAGRYHVFRPASYRDDGSYTVDFNMMPEVD